MKPAALALVACSLLTAEAAASDRFHAQVAPILQQHCVGCHSGSEPKGDLDLTRAESVIEGRGEGWAVVPGRPDVSALIDVISGESPRMPKSGQPLGDEQVAVLRSWIAEGAPWPEGFVLKDTSTWWSLRPLHRPPVPPLDPADRDWVRTPLDAFILAKLRQHGLSPSPEAHRRTLIRRLYFDLHGLPPAPEEVEAFVTDPNPQAYEKLVEVLLASPHYGERWARHWLDVVHYGDTHGYDKDKLRPHAWPYRDYVIRAFNEDKPYDRFVREQLAGDWFYPGTRDGLVALGFIAAGPFDWVGHVEVAEGTLEKRRVRNIDRDDMVSATIGTFVSLTAHCARCHDHKFDPIRQEDYYSLQAIFAAVDRADRPYDADPATARQRQALEKQIVKLTARQGALDEEAAAALQHAEAQLAALPPQELVFAAATKFNAQGNHRPTGGRPRPIHVLARGNEASPLHEVAPGTVACFPQLPSRFDLSPEHEEAERRAALADWIVDPRNSLTWRSIVNRVWQYHFGRAIVDTPNDFGRMGVLPTHPELLDWLAVEFRDGGQSLKRLHRLIVLSAAYRQASAVRDSQGAGPDPHAVDGGNRLLWRMNRQRLEAEPIRDTMLLLAGKLDRRMYGAGYRAFGFQDDHSPHYKYHEHDPDDPAAHRRSIYRFIVRSVPDPWMETLDCADPSLLVARRSETLTSLQALALLNNKFTVRMAEHFAARVEAMESDTPSRIAAAWQLALGRPPTEDELATLVPVAEQHGMANVCRLLFSLNEFIFID